MLKINLCILHGHVFVMLAELNRFHTKRFISKSVYSQLMIPWMSKLFIFLNQKTHQTGDSPDFDEINTTESFVMEHDVVSEEENTSSQLVQETSKLIDERGRRCRKEKVKKNLNKVLQNAIFTFIQVMNGFFSPNSTNKKDLSQ